MHGITAPPPRCPAEGHGSWLLCAEPVTSLKINNKNETPMLIWITYYYLGWFSTSCLLFKSLTHWPLVTNICDTDFQQHLQRKCPVAWSALNHVQQKCWFIIKNYHRNISQTKIQRVLWSLTDKIEVEKVVGFSHQKSPGANELVSIP